MTKGQPVFPTLYAGVIRCVTSPGLAPRVVNGTSQGGKVEMGYHTEEMSPVSQTPICNSSSVFRVGVFLPGLRSSLMADLC